MTEHVAKQQKRSDASFSAYLYKIDIENMYILTILPQQPHV